MKIVNLHTHKTLDNNHIGFVNNSSLEKLSTQENQIYSVGLHPWDILKAPENWLEDLKNKLQNNRVKAVGECGIDRKINISIPLQISYFEEQIKLAQEYNLPLIIHSVRSYSDLLSLHKKYKPTNHWILHAYGGNLEITKQLSKYNFYFSIGEQLIKTEKEWTEILNVIPRDKLFLETDTTNIDIKLIYQRTSEILEINFNELIEKINDNLQSILK